MQSELWMGNIPIEYPKLSGTPYHKYKGVCDADYSFTMYDIGSYGSNNDSGFFANSTFGKRLESN